VTLFDLAVFEQAFWTAARGELFYSSLEGDISHFGRHFSPFFYLLLPVYLLHQQPETLLVLQSAALGLGAVPLYLIARRRLASSPAALGLAALYLLSPMLHDINLVNEFHELAFVIPLLLLAFWAVETARWRVYGVAVVLALTVKEDVALTTAALGLYVALGAGRRWIGLATIAASIAWFIVVVELVMPELRGPHGDVPFPGYEYLGDGIFGMAWGVVTKPDELWQVLRAEPKQHYLRWLLTPVAFLALLAPEVLLVAAPGLLLVLGSTYPPTYVIFERYIAPVVPFVYLSAVIGIERVQRLALHRGRWAHLVPVTLTLVAALGTLHTQQQLGKYPRELLDRQSPSPHAAIAIAWARAIPSDAVAVVEDHRLLAHAAHRKHLYYLSGTSPLPDYLIVDRKTPPITNVPHEERAAAIQRIHDDPAYFALRCEDGITLYAHRDAVTRHGPLLDPYGWQRDHDAGIAGMLRLRGYSLDAFGITLYWEALTEPLPNLTVAVLALDANGVELTAHRGRPQDGACATDVWQQGQLARDPHPLALTADATELVVQVLDPNGAPLGALSLTP
jgi:uncharacterized membrane protein